jgi:hypothetical protein
MGPSGVETLPGVDLGHFHYDRRVTMRASSERII